MNEQQFTPERTILSFAAQWSLERTHIRFGG
jgi:hypothetical protein